MAQRRLNGGGHATFPAKQQRTLEVVPSVPLGRTLSDHAGRATLQGALAGAVRMFRDPRRG